MFKALLYNSNPIIRNFYLNFKIIPAGSAIAPGSWAESVFLFVTVHVDIMAFGNRFLLQSKKFFKFFYFLFDEIVDQIVHNSSKSAYLPRERLR